MASSTAVDVSFEVLQSRYADDEDEDAEVTLVHDAVVARQGKQDAVVADRLESGGSPAAPELPANEEGAEEDDEFEDYDSEDDEVGAALDWADMREGAAPKPWPVQDFLPLEPCQVLGPMQWPSSSARSGL